NFGFARAYAEDVVLAVIASLTALALVHAARRPVRFALIASIGLILWQFPVDGGNVERLASQRSFYGVVRVERHPGRGMNLLLHGTTVHGGQAIDPAMRLEPVTYYLRSGPFGDVFASRTPEQAERPVAVIGLGVGGLACYGRPDARWTFYEIDPLVERIARDQRFFTYLRDCPPQKEVVLGDARLSLGAAPNGAYGLIFMDAFSSDSIPIHLLTREAVELYLSKLAPDGMIVVNISHRILDLAPVLSALATDSGLAMRIARLRRLRPPIEERYGYTVDVAIMAREPRHLGNLARHPRWAPPPSPKGRPWTDDYSNPLALLPWYRPDSRSAATGEGGRKPHRERAGAAAHERE
ncbi:MAG TPA: fused MFS/spermidine synthase, partial [Alphaproteobacteria bacterium]|nr:fused MFS/spermidine synthase [Alphaproteobacteria bacterium]